MLGEFSEYSYWNKRRGRFKYNFLKRKINVKIMILWSLQAVPTLIVYNMRVTYVYERNTLCSVNSIKVSKYWPPATFLALCWVKWKIHDLNYNLSWRNQILNAQDRAKIEQCIAKMWNNWGNLSSSIQISCNKSLWDLRQGLPLSLSAPFCQTLE